MDYYIDIFKLCVNKTEWDCNKYKVKLLLEFSKENSTLQQLG